VRRRRGFKAADATGKGTIMKGPVTFVLMGQLDTPAYLTLKLMPAAYPPARPVIIAPGTNQFQVTLETSTNLVYWAAATNGVYGKSRRRAVLSHPSPEANKISFAESAWTH